MKKFLMITAAASAVLAAAPASAQATFQGQTYEDGVATYQVNAPVNSFCKFGSAGNATVLGQNAQNGPAINNGVNPGGDASFIFDIQNDSDNTVQRSDIRFDFARFVCNSPFRVTATSTNGGLLNSSQSTSDDDFLETVPYKLQFGTEMGANPATFVTSAGTITLLNSAEAQAGKAGLNIEVDPIDKLVLQGTYQDTILLTMSPNTGS